MTVEACLIIPWIVFMLVWLIYLGFFEYNRCLLFQDNYALGAQVSGQILSTSDKQKWINSHIDGWFGHKYMGTSKVIKKATVSSKNIEVESQLKVQHPLSFHLDVIPSANWKISDCIKIDNFSFSQRLRLQRGVGRLVDGGD